MRRAPRLLIMLLGLLALSHGGRGQADGPPGGPGAEEGAPSLRIAPGNAAFAFNFYHLVAALNPGSNVFFSPLSISAAYAMLALGAGADTRAQILEGLAFNLSNTSAPDIHRGFQHLLLTLNRPRGSLETRVGSALFLSQALTLRPSFLNLTATFYGAQPFPADFLEPEAAARLINSHVREETHGKIDSVVGSLSTDTVMVLVNYIYFKGRWKSPFGRSRTAPQDFHVDEHTVVKVPMMFQEQDSHWYLRDQHVPCSVLRLDYQGGARALLVLPDSGKMAQVEAVLTPGMLRRWSRLLQKRAYYRKLWLYLPKFSASGSYNLDELLPQLGIQDLFTQRANLSGIAAQDNLLVSKSVHKAVLDVDEAGTEAAAATSLSITFFSAVHTPRILKFNRPFLLAILSADTQSVLFLGKIVNPTQP
ncbi:kallistatin [Pipistrellus kuhlii]|uniref:Serpin family A member 4 n=1 Tax=Pipistrellus kuhlii TaxID=59472 RepID=A0A7J7RAC9_PIPKU|nr:kallistatin [Pipistrellus kuhlii]KAF6273033.1 serpin family A member 4 [Pipistrellus kuhlii]